MIIRARAPLRISFGGGGTDVSPYIEDKGGIVLNTTIDKYAYASLIPRTDRIINIKSYDMNCELTYSADEKPAYDGKLDLIKAAVNVLNIRQGFDLALHADAIPGSGLGSSSTMTTAIVGVFREWLNLPLTDYEIAELAYQIERVEVGIKGGKQDQYATVFGGINYIEFYKDKTIVNPLRIKPEYIYELEYRLILCNTQNSHNSGQIIDKQVDFYLRGEKKTVDALDGTKALAIEMKNALLLGRVHDVGRLLDEGWKLKKDFSDSVSNENIDSLYDLAKNNGAVGGKLLGAGGGGHMILMCEASRKQELSRVICKAGAVITDFAFEYNGLHTWKAKLK